MRSPRSLRLTDIERGSANSAYVSRAHNAAYAELCISGDATPSADDVALTHRLIQAGALLGLEILDHVVIGDRGVALGRHLDLEPREVGDLAGDLAETALHMTAKLVGDEGVSTLDLDVHGDPLVVDRGPCPRRYARWDVISTIGHT